MATSTCSAVAGGFVSNSARGRNEYFSSIPSWFQMRTLLPSFLSESPSASWLPSASPSGQRDLAQRTVDVREGRDRSLRTSCYSLVLAVAFADVVQNFKHARTAFDGLVEMKNEMRRVFQHNVPGQFRLQRRTIRLQFADYAVAIDDPESAHE